jgi:butyrate response factor 1
MTTEYYQIPSQQGLLPLEPSSCDPWLVASTSSLSLSDWSTKGKVRNPPSLFEAGDVQSVSWKHVVPIQFPVSNVKAPVRAPKTPKQFNSTASKIDAWSVVDNTVIAKPKKQLQQPPLQLQQQQPQQVQLKVLPQPAPTTDTPTTEEAKPIEDELTHQNRYKTELCKSFTETGACRYGVKCQFAHGKEEVRSILRHPKYKTETCKTFHTTGTCPYGIRCRFIHTRSKEESIVTAVKASPRLEEEEDDCEEEVRVVVNAPPGIPVPQWSKSWNMSLATAVPSKTRRHISDLSQPEPAF